MGVILHTSATRARVLEGYAEFGQVRKACQEAGVSHSMHYEWLRQYPEYRSAFERMRDPVMDLMEDEAVRRAVEGVERPMTIAGKEVWVREFSDQLLMFLLKARNRRVFGDRSDDTLKVEGELSIAQILRNRRLKRHGEDQAQAQIAAPAGTPAAAEDGSDPVIDEVVEGMNQPIE